MTSCRMCARRSCGSSNSSYGYDCYSCRKRCSHGCARLNFTPFAKGSEPARPTTRTAVCARARWPRLKTILLANLTCPENGGGLSKSASQAGSSYGWPPLAKVLVARFRELTRVVNRAPSAGLPISGGCGRRTVMTCARAVQATLWS